MYSYQRAIATLLVLSIGHARRNPSALSPAPATTGGELPCAHAWPRFLTLAHVGEGCESFKL